MPVFDRDTTKFYPVEEFGLGGLNTLSEPTDILDIELSDVRNMVFTDGILQPRNGSLLYLAKPLGETNSPNQLLTATDSNGTDYMIAWYGVNIYLADTINDQWIKLNQTYTPATGGLFYGATNWNGGTTIDNTSSATIAMSGDRFYMGNGTDDVCKWDMAITTLAVASLSTDTTLTLTDSASFPASGSVLVQVTGGGAVVIDYTANDVSTGVLTLTITADAVLPIHSTVTIQLIDVSAVPKGSVLTASKNGRLWICNSNGYENQVNFSQSVNPEDFALTSDLTSGGQFNVTEGRGGILGLIDFGNYLSIEKVDSKFQVNFNYNSDNSAFVVTYISYLNGDGIGPQSASSILNYMNVEYYPTTNQGIMSFSPSTTGSQTTSGLNVLSQTINNLVTESLDFEFARTAGLAQKLYWVCSLPTVGIKSAVNNLVIMYDLVRAAENETINSGFQIGGSAWTVFDNWNAVDIKPVNGILYYLSANDGAVYQCNVPGNYQDAVLKNPIAYTAYALSKRFNLSTPSNLNKLKYFYIEGYISLNTTFYVNVLYNEGGSLSTQSYLIAGTNKTIVVNSPRGGLGAFVLGSPLLGGVDLQTLQDAGKPLFFRAYLETSQALIWQNIQIQAFSNSLGAFWGMTKCVMITEQMNSIPTSLVLGPSSVPMLRIQSL